MDRLRAHECLGLSMEADLPAVARACEAKLAELWDRERSLRLNSLDGSTAKPQWEELERDYEQLATAARSAGLIVARGKAHRRRVIVVRGGDMTDDARLHVGDLLVADPLGMLFQSPDSPGMVVRVVHPANLRRNESGGTHGPASKTISVPRPHPSLAKLEAARLDGELCQMSSVVGPGRPLGAVLGKEGTSREQSLWIARQLCAALAQMHRTHVHGLLTPHSIWIAKDRVVVLDIGLLHLVDRTQVLARLPGLVKYFAPELRGTTAPTPLSDQFAVATILTEMLGDRMPRALERTLKVALSPDPAQRFPSMSAFADRLAAGDAESELLSEVYGAAATLGEPLRGLLGDQLVRRAEHIVETASRARLGAGDRDALLAVQLVDLDVLRQQIDIAVEQGGLGVGRAAAVQEALGHLCDALRTKLEEAVTS